jgi:hypothetical protein
MNTTNELRRITKNHGQSFLDFGAGGPDDESPLLIRVVGAILFD